MNSPSNPVFMTELLGIRMNWIESPFISKIMLNFGMMTN